MGPVPEDGDDWRRVTLVTQPVALNMQIPRCFLLAKVAKLSTTSHPGVTSMAWARSVLAFSRVIMMGGFGLFLEPAGLPRGLLVTCSLVALHSAALLTILRSLGNDRGLRLNREVGMHINMMKNQKNDTRVGDD